MWQADTIEYYIIFPLNVFTSPDSVTEDLKQAWVVEWHSQKRNRGTKMSASLIGELDRDSLS